MMGGMGLIGFLDDFLKTRKQRSLGLGGWSKILGQVVIGSIFAILAISEVFRDENGLTPGSHFISVVRDIPWLNLFAFGVPIGIALFIIWVNLIAVSASNGVNVADGLDGLASGAAIFAISAYIFIGFWQANQSCFNKLERADRRVQVLRRARSARPRGHRRGDLRRAHRVPVVEHLARADLHGRHRLARPRRRPRRPRDPQPHRAAARADRRPVPDRHRLGDPAARRTSSSRDGQSASS